MVNSDVLACVFPRLKASAASVRKCDFKSFENSLETLLKSNHVVNVCPNVELSVGSEFQNGRASHSRRYFILRRFLHISPKKHKTKKNLDGISLSGGDKS